MQVRAIARRSYKFPRNVPHLPIPSSSYITRLFLPSDNDYNQSTLQDSIVSHNQNHLPTTTPLIIKMDSLASAFGGLNMEYQVQATPNNQTNNNVFDDLTAQMNGFHIQQKAPAPTVEDVPEQEPQQHLNLEQKIQNLKNTPDININMDTTSPPPGNILLDLQILHKISRHISQTHCTRPLTKIPNVTVADLQKRAREVQEKEAYTDLEEGFSSIYGESPTWMFDTVQKEPCMVEILDGRVDGAKRRVWLKFVEKCGVQL